MAITSSLDVVRGPDTSVRRLCTHVRGRYTLIRRQHTKTKLYKGSAL